MFGYHPPLAGTPWWVPLVYIAAVGHITNVCITLYLHRSATHGGVKFHPISEHFMRLWLWLTTGVVTKEWVAVHRKHHAFSDREGDPHSPHEEGLAAILFAGLWFYRKAAQDREVVEKYGKGCPDDWIERHVYTAHSAMGIFVMMAIDMLVFGPLVGLAVWSAMALWLPIFGQIINAIGHAMGYRNFETKDESHNIYPFGIWIVGEELHNNHHADPRSAKFKAHWWEFDIGWLYIRALSFVKLAEIVYARSTSVKEFAAQYYDKNVAQPVTTRVEKASAKVAIMRDEARQRFDHALAEAREEFEEARERLERLMAEARTTDAWGRLERSAADARAAMERTRQKLERTHAEAMEAVEQMRLAAAEKNASSASA